MTEPKKLKVTFAPGCFDNFDGTQEELDALIKEIEDVISTGELLERSEELDQETWDELPTDVKLQILGAVEEYDADAEEARQRRLN